MTQKLYSKSSPPAHVNVTLFGNSLSADVIKDLEMSSPWMFWVSPKTSDSVLTGDRREGDREAHRGDGHMNTEAEIGVAQPQTEGVVPRACTPGCPSKASNRMVP